MPCGICHCNGHNRLTCPFKESPPVTHVNLASPRPAAERAREIEDIIKERNDLLEEKQSLYEKIETLRIDNLVIRDEWRSMGEQVVRLQNHINSMRKASIVCDMELRKDLAETLFDKKTDIPDGIYLELMNKLRI